MKTDDIFFALTDIDDKFIEKARPFMDSPKAPEKVFPAERKKPRRNTLIAAAACAACVTAWGAVGVNQLIGDGFFTTSPAAAPDITIDSRYPENVQYAVSEEITNGIEKLNFAYMTNGDCAKWDDESYYAKNYDQLASKSDLIVAGEFTDLPHQAQNPENVHIVNYDETFITAAGEFTDIPHQTREPEDLHIEGHDDCTMLNYFQVERVIKGDVTAGDELIINQFCSVNSNGSGEYIVFTYDRLAPMLKGDEWIYFLQKTDDGYYAPVNGPQGRYPMPNNKNADLTSGKKDGVDEFGACQNSAPSRGEIYDRLLKLLEGSPAEIVKIDVPTDNSKTDFFMAEFPEFTFTATAKEIVINAIEMNAVDSPILTAWRIDNIYLADLGGDGKREICSTIGVDDSDMTIICVYDFENGVDYYLKSDDLNIGYGLDEENGRLMAVKRDISGASPKELSREPLTLDIMKILKIEPRTYDSSAEAVARIKVPTDASETSFVMEEFPKYTSFNVTETGVTASWDTNGAAVSFTGCYVINAWKLGDLYLADLNGDGKREICATAIVDDSGVWVIRVCDLANGADYILEPDAGTIFRLSKENDTLMAVKVELTPVSAYIPKVLSREPLTLDMMKPV